MTQIPCPHCGEAVACSEEEIGRRMRCPNCRVMLRLDADAEGRPTWATPRRGFRLIRLAVVLIVFLAGLGIGFAWGTSVSAPASPGSISATSFGFFSASNNVVVSDKTVIAPSAPPKGAPAGADVNPQLGKK